MSESRVPLRYRSQKKTALFTASGTAWSNEFRRLPRVSRGDGYYSLLMASGMRARILAASVAICIASVNLLTAFGTPCSVHDPAFAKLTAPGHGAGSPAVRRHMHDHGQSQTSAPGQHHDKSQGCSCVGCACCQAPFSLPSLALAFAPAALRAGTTVPLPGEVQFAISRAAHSLPFPTAPPPSA
jgi:hypothetical protein